MRGNTIFGFACVGGHTLPPLIRQQSEVLRSTPAAQIRVALGDQARCQAGAISVDLGQIGADQLIGQGAYIEVEPLRLPRSMTCLTASALNSEVNRWALIDFFLCSKPGLRMSSYRRSSPPAFASH